MHGRRVYYVPAQPSDIELGPRHTLYVSTFAYLTPNVVSTYGLSRVYTVSPTRKLTMIGDGFDGALGLAVTTHGSVYVAENFRPGQGSADPSTSLRQVGFLLARGRPLPVFNLPFVAGLEWGRGTLYASTSDEYWGGRFPGDVDRLATH